MSDEQTKGPKPDDPDETTEQTAEAKAAEADAKAEATKRSNEAKAAKERAEAADKRAEEAIQEANEARSKLDATVDAARAAARSVEDAAGGALAATADRTIDGETALWILGLVAVPVLLAWFLWQGTGAGIVGTGQNTLRIYPTAEIAKDENKWTVSGAVQFDNQLVEGALVRAVLRDDRGSLLTNTDTTGTDGRFSIAVTQTVPEGGQRPRVRDIEVTASYEEDGWFTQPLSAYVTLTPDRRGSNFHHWSSASTSALYAALVLFLFCFFYCLLPSKIRIVSKAKHFASIVLSFGFTALMILFIGSGIQDFSTSESKSRVFALGFANIYYGSFVKGAPSDWVLSLSAPPSQQEAADETTTDPTETGEGGGSEAGAAVPEPPDPAEVGQGPTPRDLGATALVTPSETLSRGFGAPIWLILLATVGAALFIVRLAVEHLRTPVDFNQPQQIRTRQAKLITYQSYVLFAPIGAIFVYQILVAAGHGDEPATIGFAALASGIAMGALLDRAWGFLSPMISESTKPQPRES